MPTVQASTTYCMGEFGEKRHPASCELSAMRWGEQKSGPKRGRGAAVSCLVFCRCPSVYRSGLHQLAGVGGRKGSFAGRSIIVYKGLSGVGKSAVSPRTAKWKFFWQGVVGKGDCGPWECCLSRSSHSRSVWAGPRHERRRDGNVETWIPAMSLCFRKCMKCGYLSHRGWAA